MKIRTTIVNPKDAAILEKVGKLETNDSTITRKEKDGKVYYEIEDK